MTYKHLPLVAASLLFLSVAAPAQNVTVWLDGGVPYPGHYNADRTFEWLQQEPDGWDDQNATWDGDDPTVIDFGSKTMEMEQSGDVEENGQMEIGSWEWGVLQ